MQACRSSSLRMVQKQATNKQMQAIIAEVITDVEAGSSFSVALQKHPETPSILYLSVWLRQVKLQVLWIQR